MEQQQSSNDHHDESTSRLALMDPVWIHRHSNVYLEGIVEYLGAVDFSDDGDDWVGIRLTGPSEGLGKNSGSVQGRFYFDAPSNCGLFVRKSAVQKRVLTKREEIRFRRDYYLGGGGDGSGTSKGSSPTASAKSSRIKTPSTSPRKHYFAGTGMTLDRSRLKLNSPRSSLVTTSSISNNTPTSATTTTTSPRKQSETTQKNQHQQQERVSSSEAKAPNKRKGDNKTKSSTNPSARATTNSDVEDRKYNEESSLSYSTSSPGKAASAMTMIPDTTTTTTTTTSEEEVVVPAQRILRTPLKSGIMDAPTTMAQTVGRTTVVEQQAAAAAHDDEQEADDLVRCAETYEPLVDDKSSSKIPLAKSPHPAFFAPSRAAAAEPATPSARATAPHSQSSSSSSPPQQQEQAKQCNDLLLQELAEAPSSTDEEEALTAVAPISSPQQVQTRSCDDLLLRELAAAAAPSTHDDDDAEEEDLIAITSTEEDDDDEEEAFLVIDTSHGEETIVFQDEDVDDDAPDEANSSSRSSSNDEDSPAERQLPSGSTAHATARERRAGSEARPASQSRSQQHMSQRRREQEAVMDGDSSISTMNKCQAWTTLLFTWITILPLYALATVLLWKPSLLFPESDDKERQSFFTLLAGGLLLGQTLSHMILLLPLTGDCLCPCCWSIKGIRSRSIAASRMAAVGTAWIGLVLLLSTLYIIQHQESNHGNESDDNNDTPFLMLLASSAATLVLSCLSLMVSFLPCSSASGRDDQASARTGSGSREGLLEPLLASSSENGDRPAMEEEEVPDAETDEEAPSVLDGSVDSDQVDDPAPTSRVKGTRRLLQLASSQVFYLYSGCFVLLIRLPFSISIPHFVSTTISALAQGQFERARHEVFFLFVLGSIDAALDFWGFFLFGYANLRIVRDLRLDLFSRILNMEVGFFDVNNTGALSSRLNNDCSAMAGDLTWFFRFSIESVVRITGITAYMLIRSPKLGACALSIVPIVAAVNKWYGNWLAKNAAAVQDALAQANAVAQEALTNVRTVIAFAAEEDEQDRYEEKIEDQYQLSVKQLFMQSVYYMAISTFLINTVVQSALLWIGAYMIEHNQLTAEVLLAFMLYQGQLQNETMNLFQSYTSLIQSSGAGEKVFALLDRTPPPPAMGSSEVEANRQWEDADDDTVAAIQRESSHILQLDQVTFGYPSRPDHTVLDQFDLVIPQGKTVALVGPSGVGKTTIVHLLQRFYDPSGGAVLVDGIDLRRLDLQLHRRSIGVVTQDCILFDGTILDNIMFGSCSPRSGEVSSAARHEAIRAAVLAHADIFVREFAEGYDTPVGEGGVQLSGGQKQRIAIARAIFKKPSLLLLDEATSSLDSQSEQIVQQALDELLQRSGANMTTVVIAHRLKTVVRADLIAVLGPEGRVVERGNHQGLMQRPNGIYRTMVERASTSGMLPENLAS